MFLPLSLSFEMSSQDLSLDVEVPEIQEKVQQKPKGVFSNLGCFPLYGWDCGG